jgi:hypothetical protein
MMSESEITPVRKMKRQEAQKNLFFYKPIIFECLITRGARGAV